MLRHVVGLLAVIGCGSRTAPLDLASSGSDASVRDAETVDGTDEAETSAVRQWCSTLCGAVDGAADAAFLCPVGQVCGQTGGVQGFRCCELGPLSVCMRGFPAPGSGCP
jgi:hypothetical protein